MTRTLLADKALMAKLTAVAKAAGKLDDQIVDVANDVLVHFGEHKDVTMVNRLYLALGKGARHEAMAEWIMAFFAVKPNTDKASKADMPFVTDRLPNGDWARVTNVVGGLQVPWHDFKKSKTPDTMFDFTAAVKALVKKYNNATEVKGVTPEQMAEIAKMAGIASSDVKRPAIGAKAAETAMEAVGAAPM